METKTHSSTGAVALGAVWRDGGVDFRLRAPAASAVELCLFSRRDPTSETGRISLSRADDGWWRVRVDGDGDGDGDGIGAGLPYGYRVDGPFDPDRGLRFDRAKLLLDPRAGAITASPCWHPSLLAANRMDSAARAPRSVVIDPTFDWDGDRRPEVPWARTVIYECHVRGMTRRHPRVAAELRGTYLGLAQPAVIEHLLALGVTTLELMPVQHFVAERHLAQGGRANYWGYSPIGWLAPHAGYAGADTGAQVTEFKTMVRELHRAGLEVVLDLVLNHTAEGGGDGLTLGPRGIDNPGFYRLHPDDRSRYVDFTGCGNTVDAGDAGTRALWLDALRYWAEEMHVDGFRFDLAPVLGRGEGGFSATAPFFREVAADPLLSRLKLIAEPWDLGPGGAAEGAFPAGWREWNGRYRDALRAFWRGEPSTTAEVATRLGGSSDLYARRGPLTGVNYVACHDGFTLRDLVSYERKHNLANGEDNRDGSEHNLSRNWGIEGPTDDPEVLARRARASRNLLAGLALSAGVPMLGHGDELGRTQHGNNNAYCHDSELTWVDWELDAERRDLLVFTREVFRLRRELGLFDRSRFFSSGELLWLHPTGRPMQPADWEDPELRTLVALHRPEDDRRALLVLHAGAAPAAIELPPAGGASWSLRLTTADDVALEPGRLEAPAYSLTVLAGGAGSGADGGPDAAASAS